MGSCKGEVWATTDASSIYKGQEQLKYQLQVITTTKKIISGLEERGKPSSLHSRNVDLVSNAK